MLRNHRSVEHAGDAPGPPHCRRRRTRWRRRPHRTPGADGGTAGGLQRPWARWTARAPSRRTARLRRRSWRPAKPWRRPGHDPSPSATITRARPPSRRRPRRRRRRARPGPGRQTAPIRTRRAAAARQSRAPTCARARRTPCHRARTNAYRSLLANRWTAPRPVPGVRPMKPSPHGHARSTMPGPLVDGQHLDLRMRPAAPRSAGGPRARGAAGWCPVRSRPRPGGPAPACDSANASGQLRRMAPGLAHAARIVDRERTCGSSRRITSTW